MGMWLSSHPLWKSWEVRIQERPETVVCSVMMDYCRIDSTLSFESNADFTQKEILPSSWIEIKALSQKLKAVDLDRFVAIALDFDAATFSSPRLREVSQGGFFRRYFLITQGSDEFMAVFTRYNRATTFNRIPDAVYLCSLKKEASHQSVKAAINKAYILSLEIGLEIPSVRYVFADPTDSLDMTSSMKCYLLTYEGFLLFEGFR